MNNFHIYEEIGKGKCSIVYKGRKKMSLEYVAVKSTEKLRRKKVLNEVKIFHNLNHPNILKFYNWYETKNHLWIIFEYCSGGDLMQMVEQDKEFPENVVKYFAKDLANGLAYLHSQGIIYCDLKLFEKLHFRPSNILMNENGDLKLSDFGLAKKLIDMFSQNIDQDSKRGTPYYMAPELFQENGVHSFQSDLWSLGCVLYELACGHPPFISSSFSELVNLIEKGETPILSNYSERFNNLINGLLQKDPAKRISWEQLKSHKFWDNFQIVFDKIPSQPHYDKFIKQRNGCQDEPINQLANELQNQDPQYKNGKEINILRLSKNVIKNMEKDKIDGYDNNKAMEQEKDIKLSDMDQEIDMGDFKDEDSCEDNLDKDDHEYQEDSDFETSKTPLDLGQVQQQPNTRVKKENSSDHLINQLNFQNQQTPNPQFTKESPMIANNNPKSKLIALEQLFNHNSDTAVKPIIGNREIEKLAEITYNKNILSIQSYTAEEVAIGIETKEIEDHFSEMYGMLSSNFVEKLNLLNYLEIIVQNSNVANRLINSAFMELLLKILRSNKNAAMKIRICAIIGQLLRFATIIEIDVSQIGLTQALIETFQEKNIYVKRRAIAALGEYLFYAATQKDEEQNNEDVIKNQIMLNHIQYLLKKLFIQIKYFDITERVYDHYNLYLKMKIEAWDIDSSSINALTKGLKQVEDDIIRLYCCKTIENITAQTFQTGFHFANADMVTVIYNIQKTTKLESLKVSAVIVLNHLARLNIDLINLIMDKLTIKHIFQVFGEGNSRIQQAYITILNMFILQNHNQVQILNEQFFINRIVQLLENGITVIKGKATLTVLLLIKISPMVLATLSIQTKFFQAIDKLVKDQNQYVQYCLQHLIESIADISIDILKIVQEELSKLKQSQSNELAYYNNQIGKQKSNEQIKGNLMLLNVLFYITNTQLLQKRIVDRSFLATIFEFLKFCDDLTNQQADEVKSTLFMIFEAISTSQQILMNHKEIMINQILPDLFQQTQNQNVDTRFNCLKIFTDIIIQYLNDDLLGEYILTINNFVQNKVIPQLKPILQDQDPLPVYGFKLLSFLIDKNEYLVSALKKYKYLNLIIEFYNQQKLNMNVLQLIKRLVQCNEISLADLQQVNFLQKSTSLLQNFFAIQQEWCLEQLLDILMSFSHKIISEIQKIFQLEKINPENLNQPQLITKDKNILGFIQNYSQLNEIFPIIIQLTSHVEYRISERAYSFIITQIYLFADFNDQMIVASVAIQLIINLSKTQKLNEFKKILHSIYWIIYFMDSYQKQNIDNTQTLVYLIDQLQSTDDKTLIYISNDILRSLNLK